MVQTFISDQTRFWCWTTIRIEKIRFCDLCCQEKKPRVTWEEKNLIWTTSACSVNAAKLEPLHIDYLLILRFWTTLLKVIVGARSHTCSKQSKDVCVTPQTDDKPSHWFLCVTSCAAHISPRQGLIQSVNKNAEKCGIYKPSSNNYNLIIIIKSYSVKLHRDHIFIFLLVSLCASPVFQKTDSEIYRSFNICDHFLYGEDLTVYWTNRRGAEPHHTESPPPRTFFR